MTARKVVVPAIVVSAAALAFAALTTRARGPVGNKAVPQPAKPVELTRYLGLWYEIGRYESSFERGCEAVTADYRLRGDGLIQITNRYRKGGIDRPLNVTSARAKVVEGSDGAKLKVSFFGPFFVGDYWVLDRADNYDWSIVGEPSGRYLWLLSRKPDPSARVRKAIESRVRALGYDTSLIRPTQH
jgi:apolipoprotein D and lipocalin family protein